ncbi:MmgE/PrpD family protein [Lonsdalea iberica]|uniref:MmgE/PrpD family protein n=1 Tax=Lonsdalea iberica TaxID=1082703 RepID=UPI00111C6384|nr:MmgE/PrpD family protein [Lonsdalea iberica]
MDKGLVDVKQVLRNNDRLSHSLRLGYAGHALDFDDVPPALRDHPSTVILPALTRGRRKSPLRRRKIFSRRMSSAS